MKKITISMVLASMLLVSTAQAEKNYGTVNGQAITEAELSATLGQAGMSYDSLPPQMQKKVLDMVVERKLLTEAALKSGIEKSDEYKKQLEMVKQDLALDAWMRKEMKSIEASLTDEKLAAEYKKNKEQYSEPKQLQARHILFMVDQSLKDEKKLEKAFAEAKVKAEALVKELDTAKDKKAKFIELAKAKSEGPSGKNGGDLGWFPLDRMVPEFSAAADKLKKGDYTKEPVKTQFGYHLIMLDDRKDASVKPFEAVKEQIKTELSNKLFSDKMKETTDALKKSAKIELPKSDKPDVKK